MNYEEFFSGVVEKLSIHQSGQAYGLCPLHPDKIKSFSVNLRTSQWRCHGCQLYGNAITLARRLGIACPSSDSNMRPATSSPPALTAAAGVATRAEPAAQTRTVIATYTYRDEKGSPLFQVIRTEPKGFFQKRFENGQWIPGLGETRRVIYNLPEVIQAQSFIILVEGEKDADRLVALGLTATTSPMGAGKWSDDYSAWFKGKRVVIIPDNDEPGELHGMAAARSIIAAGGNVKLLRLPGLPPKGDVSDYLSQGRTKDELIELIKSTPVFGMVIHTNEPPLDYFRRMGAVMTDSQLRLPHEFKPLCKEAFDEFTRLARRLTDSVQEQIDLAEKIWANCRSHSQYNLFLRTLKKAHELSLADQ